MDMLVVYALIKLAAYFAHCYAGLLHVTHERQPDAPIAGRALAYGLLRWLLGAVIGTCIFMTFPHGRSDWVSYLVLYTPVRVVEWGIIALLIKHRYGLERLSWGWIAIGIGVSYAADVASPDFLIHGLSGRVFC